MQKYAVSLLLIAIALAACAAPTPSTPTPIATSNPSESTSSSPTTGVSKAGFNPACGESGLLDRGVYLAVESQLGEHPGWVRAIDTNAGITFVTPAGWEIYQYAGVICLNSPANPAKKLVIAFKPADSPADIRQKPASADKLTPGGQVVFLNQRIDKTLVTGKSGLTTILYNAGNEIAADGLSFSLSFGNMPGAGTLADADRVNAELILQSFDLVKITHWESISPGGELAAVQTRAMPANHANLHQVYQRLNIVRQNSVVWTTVDEWQEDALGMTMIKPVRWSADSRYFYFARQPWVDGCTALPINGSTLARVDSVSGKVDELYPGWAFYIALSPDESQLAYIAEGSRDLVFRDLATFAERRVSLDPGWDFDAGYITWSPDGRHVALTLANLPCQADDPSIEPFSKSTSTLLVNADTFEVRTLISEDPDHRIVLGWTSPWRIELQNSKGDKSYIDIKE